jgi:hypothetical protein
MPELVLPALRAVQGLVNGRSTADRDIARLRAAMSDPAMTLGEAPDPVESLVPFLVRAGHLDEARVFLDLGMARGYVPIYEWLMVNPNLAPLKADPRLTQEPIIPSSGSCLPGLTRTSGHHGSS